MPMEGGESGCLAHIIADPDPPDQTKFISMEQAGVSTTQEFYSTETPAFLEASNDPFDRDAFVLFQGEPTSHRLWDSRRDAGQ